jgi:hypothetical protein
MGRFDICNLRYDQVTWPGTHNSGSGFNGEFKLLNGLPAPACVYRNQDMNYTAQLDFGIRWFDIDLCWVAEDEANSAVSAGLWTCHSNGYAGKVDEILRQVDEWLNESPNQNEIVSLFYNGDYDRSHSQPIAEALNDLLVKYWDQTRFRNKRGRNFLSMNTDINLGRGWPTLSLAARSNERVFVFLHESLQLGDQLWAHDPVPSRSPREVVKDSCDGLIEFTRGACDVCTDLFGVDAIGNRGNCIFKTAEICNTVTYNVSRACFDLRMEYNKTLNVIEVDFPARSPDGLSVVDVADKLNDLNFQFFFVPFPIEVPENITVCNPGFTPTPPPSPRPRPDTYCEALKQISETPLYYFQCSPNDACDKLECPLDLFANGQLYEIEISVTVECDEPAFLVVELFGPSGASFGRVSAKESGVETLLAFPLNITIDQMKDAIGAGVVLESGDNRRNIDSTILEYQIIPLPDLDCPTSSVAGVAVRLGSLLLALAAALLLSL